MTNQFLPQRIRDALSNDQALTRALFERPASLSALFPYGDFIPHYGVFQNRDGSFGAVFEGTLLEHEPMATDQIVWAVDQLKAWFIWPENCTFQVLFEQSYLSAMDEKLVAANANDGDAHPVSQMLFDKKLEQIKRRALKQNQESPLQRRIYIAVRYFPKVDGKKGMANALGRDEITLHAEMSGFVKELKAFTGRLKDFEAASPIPVRRLDPDGLLVVLRRFFNPKSIYDRSFAKYNSSVPISEQILFHSPELDHSGITREGIKTRTLSLKTSPQHVYPGGMAYFTKLLFPYRIAINFSFPTKEQTKRFFDIKEFFLQNTPSAKSKRQQQEVLSVQDKLVKGDQCLHMTFNVIIEGRDNDELDERTREVLSVVHNYLDCEAIVETDVGLGLCLNALPLFYTPKSDHSTQRFIRIMRTDVTKLLPIFDSFRGLSNPRQLYLSRENNLVPFSLLENETSNHTVVLADTGSGKSAFVIDCIQSAKRMDPEPLVFVIDKKSSYLMLSKYFDADLTVFDQNGEIPFSPFRGVYDDAKFAFLTNLLAAAIKLSSPTYPLESDQMAALTRAIKLAYAKKLNTSGLTYMDGELVKKTGTEDICLSMDDIIEELGGLTSERDYEAFGQVIEDLTVKLKPFYGDGNYAKFFNASGSPSVRTGKFFIYDLDALDSDPLLQTLMTMAVIEEIRQTIARPENTGRGGFIVVEELGMIGGDNPVASRFIKDAAETFRKLGYWLIALTPRPQNYFEIEAGRAMWGVADNFIFLQMSEDNVRYLKEKSSLLDEASAEIVKSLRTVKNQFADVFYLNKKKTRQGAFRFVQTPYDRWLSPTNAIDAETVKDAMGRFGDKKWEALEYLVSLPN